MWIDRWEFSSHTQFVVYMAFLTAAENLKTVETASRLSYQCFIELRYLELHFSLTLSSASLAFASSGAWQIVLRSVSKAFLSLSGTYFKLFLTWCTLHHWYSVLGNAVEIASLIPLRPSAQRIRISFTPRFFNSFNTQSQYLALSLSPTLIFLPSVFSLCYLYSVYRFLFSRHNKRLLWFFILS